MVAKPIAIVSEAGCFLLFNRAGAAGLSLGSLGQPL
jgi:hypothetical protein